MNTLKINSAIITWLLKSEPWTEYRTRLDLLEEPPETPAVIDAHTRLINHPLIRNLVVELEHLSRTVLTSHKSACHPLHKLAFAADFGMRLDDPGMRSVINKIFEHISDEGPFQSLMNIPVHFGGTGQNQYAWALCDAPTIIYSLTRFGLGSHPAIIKACDFLIQLGRANGYPCVCSKEMGRFRGPGRKDDPCPYATLLMLKLMTCDESAKNSEYARQSIAILLDLWEHSQTLHPYMFYMGTDFRKLKAPFIWYDILHFAEILSHYQHAIADPRFREIIALLESKADNQGKFTAESVWQAWQEWDFGQKKQHSAWLTFLVYRIKKRILTEL